MTKHHHHSYQSEDTENLIKLKSRKWWAKWISISGIATIAAVLVALPQLKEVFAYGHDLIVSPISIKALNADTAAAIKRVQGELDTVQLHEYEGKAWRARTDERLDNMEKMLTRILDNQERQARYNPTPKQNNPN